MSEELQGQSPQSGEGVQAPAQVEGQVQSNEGVADPKQAVAYQAIQSRADHLAHQVESLEEYPVKYQRVVEQNEKLTKTVSQLENDLVVAQLVAANPHLKPLAEVTNFSGWSTDQINQWGEQAHAAIKQVGVQSQPTQQPSAPAQPEEAPDIESAQAGAGGSELSIEAFNALSVEDQEKYLKSRGI